MPRIAKATRTPARASLEAALRFAWDAGAFTSSDAMAGVGLTRSTAIEAIDALIDLGLIRELPNARAVGAYSKGRPARRFELDGSAGLVVGVDAGRSHVTTMVTDLRGVPRHQATVDADPGDDWDERRALIDTVVRETVNAVGDADDRPPVLAACVGVPAPVDDQGRSPDHRQGFWRRSNPDLLGMLRRSVPLVRVANDASLAAVAEGAVGAAQGCDNYVALLAGLRFGMGVVVDGHLLRGAHGGAGETIAFNHIEGVSRSSGVGERLEVWANEARDSGRMPATHPLTDLPRRAITAERVVALAAAGDPLMGEVVARAATMLARISGVIGSFYNPEKIIVSGAVAAGLDQLVEQANAVVAEHLDLPAPTLIASPLGGEIVALGAVSAARELARDGVLTLMQNSTVSHP
ncbi:MAG: ROK family protein [Propioniciclava sp.]|uniref:ROK family protein n=1 Tax=Propioniciclava sp. TaxID=2038686 RepID=UPI0039E3096B